MSITAVVTSVGYGDFLQLTLPSMLKAIDRVVVATDENDLITSTLCHKHGVPLVMTDAWQRGGAPFNKAAGIWAAIEFARRTGELDWLMLLDADIYIPSRARAVLVEEWLDRDVMYSAPRRMARRPEDWARMIERGNVEAVALEERPRVVSRRGRPMLWGKYPTTNSVGIQGYMQLWHWPTYPQESLPESSTAAMYDIALALLWSDDRRVWLPTSVVHLGENKKNWSGRVTASWADVPPIPIDKEI